MNFNRLTILLMILAALAACGKKGPVRPKLLPLPAAPSALTIEQRGERFLVSWRIPETNQDGSPLDDLAGFRVERMRYAVDAECPECRDDFLPVAQIELDFLGEAVRLGDHLFWWDDHPQPGNGYAYRVAALTTRGRAGAPATERRLFLLVPLPPRNLVAEPHDRMARLRWEPPMAVVPMEVAPTEAAPMEVVPAPAVSWNVYRWRAGAPPALTPVNDRPLGEPFYEDFGLENGERYVYVVTRVVVMQNYPAESVPAGPVETVPQAGK